MIKIVDYVPDHLSKIKLRACHQNEKIAATGVHTHALTFLLEDQPIAIFGGYFVGTGVFHIWGLVSDDVKKKPLAFHKACKLFLDFWHQKYNVRRIQISVRADYPDGYKWAKRLGFECEGLMRGYSADGMGCHLFGRLA